MADVEYSVLAPAQNVVPLDTLIVGPGIYRNSDVLRALARSYAIQYLDLTDVRIEFADGEPPNTRPRVRTPVRTMEVCSSTPDTEADLVAYLLDPRCALDIRRARSLRFRHNGVEGPEVIKPEAAAALVRAMHTTLDTLEIMSPWLDERGRMRWSPLVIAPHVVVLSLVFRRMANRRHTPEVLREIFRDLRQDHPLQDLYIEVSLPKAKLPKIRYLGEPVDEEEKDNDNCQDAKWQAFEMTFISICSRYLSNFRKMHIEVIGQGGDQLEGWLAGLKKRNWVTIINKDA